jgi:hypothetical protein
MFPTLSLLIAGNYGTRETSSDITFIPRVWSETYKDISDSLLGKILELKR